MAAVWDRFSASDPGLLRLMAGLRTVGAIALTLFALALLDTPVNHLVAGAMAAMAATFAISERRVSGQAITLALGWPTALAAMTLGAVLNGDRIAGDVFFVVLIAGAVYARRFGDRGTALGVIGFQVYFISLFVRARPAGLWSLFVTLSVAFACAAFVRFAVVPATPEGALVRLRRAFRARLAQVVDTQRELVDIEPERLEKGVAQLRRDTARLHECALMIQGRLEDGTRDEAAAALVQRRIADAEIAAERLGVLLLKARSYEGADTLTLHLPDVALAASSTPVRREDETTRLLRRDLGSLHLLITRLAPEDRGAGVAVLRNRLLSYRDEDNLPRASLAVQDVFRGIGELARAVLGLRLAFDGPQDESDDTPETTRSREEFEAEDASMSATREEPEAEEEPKGLNRPTTRAAFQVAVGSTLAIVGGEFLSAQRWYWAVLTCWVVFLNTTSTGEILVKGYRRLIGTVAGVVAGVLLAGLVGHHTWTAFALALLCVFGMFFTAPLSYALMSFFVTAMLGLLYTLLNTYSLAVLVLRIEETALGASCGIIAAFLVLPVRTHHHTDQQLREVLTRLREVASAAVDQLSGGTAGDLLDLSRELDTALDDLRRSTRPLTHPITPLRVRRRTARYLVGLLETCAYHARALAATAELVPYSKRIAADPRLKRAGERIERNLGVLIAHLGDERAEGEVESGASIAAMLESGSTEVIRPGTVTFRVLRHLQRLDEGVAGLARPLCVPVARGDRPAERHVA
ncbi:integral membrane protein [Streptantibioticus cattleyicolor NRRL 8057 = DSM 46488]|uniref:Integral membrane protein n=1 Tax=Streptantibioticus cattleyicolor (strain ATCC 35852 / DSM 46488 / JCM 4925 / NBRC 14057 / NRRL 8057) TaxID=1003195 RepID=F8K0C5_STREN|nr:integral membrane protein [Streptantibioticus cattleyicolor NRRL 8057 = DSM 46488]MYS60639.1 FUSC family protein [Streptomyces sp. SID5468]CCB76447.1 Integral membrane protein [Streptantibioticus cattleyicolor NRRL 8057 = DSM 46488]